MASARRASGQRGYLTVSVVSLLERLAEPSILIAPGVADAMAASMAESAGFEAVFLSGSAMAYTHLGRPDIGMLSLAEVSAITARICERIDIPVFVDADSGFGNAYQVYRCIRSLESSGAHCIQIEDQVHDKRPGEITSRPVIPATDMCDKLRAALDARRSEHTLISARSDAVYSEGVDAALDRALQYAEIGIDQVFVEGLTEATDRKRLVDGIGGRCALLFNTALPGGAVSPDTKTLQFEGFSVALFPATIGLAAAQATHDALTTLLDTCGLTQPTETLPQPGSVNEAIRGTEFVNRYQQWRHHDDE